MDTKEDSKTSATEKSVEESLLRCMVITSNHDLKKENKEKNRKPLEHGKCNIL